MTEPQRKRLAREMKKAARRFHVGLMHPAPPSLSLLRLMMFRIARTNIMPLDQSFRDNRYFKEMGWFESDYYHDTALGPIKKKAGCFFDFLAGMIFKVG